MKNSLIITVMLAAALQLSAQSNRSRSSNESAATVKKTENPEKVEKPENRRATRVSTTTARPAKQATPARSSSQGREAVRPSSTARPATQANPARSSSQNREAVRKTTPARTQGNETVRPATPEGRTAPRTTTTTTPVNRERSVNVGNTPSTTNRSAQSVRGDTYKPVTGREYEQIRRTYETPARKTVVRTTYYNTGYVHRPVEYRRVHYPYRAPARVEIYWSVPMYHEYRRLYPDYRYWYYPIGYRINTVSAYDAGSYIGEIARIYGRVNSTWYSRKTNEYYLYFGGPYPYQDFSLIIPGNIARRYNRRPELFFTNRYITVTGLVSNWEGRPEILVRKRTQLEIY